MICKLKNFFRTLRYCIATGDWETEVDGCDYVEDEVIENARVTVLRCVKCGKYDIGWERKTK